MNVPGTGIHDMKRKKERKKERKRERENQSLSSFLFCLGFCLYPVVRERKESGIRFNWILLCKEYLIPLMMMYCMYIESLRIKLVC